MPCEPAGECGEGAGSGVPLIYRSTSIRARGWGSCGEEQERTFAKITNSTSETFLAAVSKTVGQIVFSPQRLFMTPCASLAGLSLEGAVR